MPYMNRVFLTGYLAADPELRETKIGPVVNFTVAANTGKETGFFACEAWGNWGINLTKTARKGSLVVVEGQLIQGKWMDEEAEETRSRVKVRAGKVFHVTAQYKGPEHVGRAV